MQIIYRSSNIMEAHIIAGLLDSRDIRSYVGGHYLQGGIGEIAPLDIATVLVDEENTERALALVKEYEKGTLDSEDHQLDYKQASGKRAGTP